MATGDENHGDQLVHADLTRSLLLKLPQLLLWSQIRSALGSALRSFSSFELKKYKCTYFQHTWSGVTCPSPALLLLSLVFLLSLEDIAHQLRDRSVVCTRQQVAGLNQTVHHRALETHLKHGLNHRRQHGCSHRPPPTQHLCQRDSTEEHECMPKCHCTLLIILEHINRIMSYPSLVCAEVRLLDITHIVLSSRLKQIFTSLKDNWAEDTKWRAERTCEEESRSRQRLCLHRSPWRPVVEGGETVDLGFHFWVHRLPGQPLLLHGEPLELAQKLPVHRVARTNWDVTHISSHHQATRGKVSLVLAQRGVPVDPVRQDALAAEALHRVVFAQVVKPSAGQFGGSHRCVLGPVLVGLKSLLLAPHPEPSPGFMFAILFPHPAPLHPYWRVQVCPSAHSAEHTTYYFPLRSPKRTGFQKKRLFTRGPLNGARTMGSFHAQIL
ncbi:hypothetical protein DNTS_011050 [Danionella cerebrum]|uniref:Uncharacterized protein n=1 Tax=Danionella cerebrum TaxID=2873325 RepID=A0A553RG60_9TELE|nr:hypothetical protein DNTS_011050 [Danionella translucida]